MSLTPMLMTQMLADERRRELTEAATRRRRSRVAASRHRRVYARLRHGDAA
jgi:hypothetical protein